ncbi:MCP four helix bundle domain-containing protein, partial [Modestobacter lapidis]
MSTAPRQRAGWFTDRPIGVKIGAVIALLAVVVLGTNLLAVTRITELRAGQETIYTENLQSQTALAEVQRANAAHRARTLEYAVSSPERRAELVEQMEEKNADLQAGYEAYEQFIVNPAAMDNFLSARDQFLTLLTTDLFPAADRGDFAGFAGVQSVMLQPLLQIMADGLEAEGVAQAEQAAARNAEAAAMADRAIKVLLGTAIAAVLVAGALTFWVVRRIMSTVRSVQSSVEAMAAGDLTVVPEARDSDEVGRMAQSLAEAQESLRGVLSTVAASADAVAASSEELSASSAQISASAEETSAQSGVVSAAAEE